MRDNTLPSRTKLAWWKIMVFTLSTTCFALLLLEAVFRVYAFLQDQDTIDRLQQVSMQKARNSQDQALTLGQILRVSRNPRLIFELIPGLRCIFHGQKLVVNRHGFRGPNYPVIKPPGTVRILGLGDSVMFGWGIHQQKSFLELLGKALNKKHPVVRWQIINTAVPGYNTVMEVETLAAKGLDFSPDLIVVGVTINDLDLPNFVQTPENYFDLTKSFLLEFIHRAISRSKRQTPELYNAPFLQKQGRFEYRKDKVPEAYRDMVGFDSFKHALKRLSHISRKEGIPVLIFLFRGFPIAIEDLCRKSGFFFLEGGPILEAHMKNHGIRQYRGSELTLSYQDPHPSVVGHILFSQRIYRFLQDSGLIQRLKQKTAQRTRM